MQFDYQAPSKNFDRNKVKGPVAKLIQVHDPTTTTALEVTAGGKVNMRVLLCACAERERDGTYPYCIVEWVYVVRVQRVIG